MVAFQEELDWVVYAAFDLVSEGMFVSSADFTHIEPLQSEHRPFAIHLARLMVKGARTSYWFDAMSVPPVAEVPHIYRTKTREWIEKRLQLVSSDAKIALVESPDCKRKWEPLDGNEEWSEALFEWMTDRVE